MSYTTLPGPEQNPRRILVVDGDGSTHETVASSLRTTARGYEVVSTDVDGRPGELLEHFRPHVVILDALDESGLEVCREIRRASERSNVRIIVLGSRSDSGDTERALLYDADLFLTKPQPIQALEAHIEELLEF